MSERRRAIYLRVEGQTETRIGTVGSTEQVPTLLRLCADDLEGRMRQESEGEARGNTT